MPQAESWPVLLGWGLLPSSQQGQGGERSTDQGCDHDRRARQAPLAQGAYHEYLQVGKVGAEERSEERDQEPQVDACFFPQGRGEEEAAVGYEAEQGHGYAQDRCVAAGLHGVAAFSASRTDRGQASEV